MWEKPRCRCQNHGQEAVSTRGGLAVNVREIADAFVADPKSSSASSWQQAVSTCVAFYGAPKVPAEGTKQKVELRFEGVVHVGPAEYLLSKTNISQGVSSTV